MEFGITIEAVSGSTSLRNRISLLYVLLVSVLTSAYLGALWIGDVHFSRVGSEIQEWGFSNGVRLSH